VSKAICCWLTPKIADALPLLSASLPSPEGDSPIKEMTASFIGEA